MIWMLLLSIFLICLLSVHKEMHLPVFSLCRCKIWEAEGMEAISPWAVGSFSSPGEIWGSVFNWLCSPFCILSVWCAWSIGEVRLEKSRDGQQSTVGPGMWALGSKYSPILWTTITISHRSYLFSLKKHFLIPYDKSQALLSRLKAC